MRAFVLAGTVLAVATASAPAGATLMDSLSVEDLCRRASAVVIGTVSASDTEWMDGRIYTFTDLEVHRVVAGARVGRRIVVRTLGGRVGSYEMVVAGTPRLRIRSKVLLFLGREARGAFQIVGLSQGIYEVRPTASALTAEPMASGMTLLGNAPTARPLDALIEEVQLAWAAR